MTKTTNKKH